MGVFYLQCSNALHLPVDRRGQPDTVCSLALQKEIHGAADCYQNAYRYWGPRMNIASLRMWG